MEVVMMDAVAAMQAAALKSWLDAAGALFLGLYGVELDLTPRLNDATRYSPPAYPAYAPAGVGLSWSAPARLEVGAWFIESGPWSFPVVNGTADAKAFGWFLVRDGSVVYAAAFEQPLELPVGTRPPDLTLRLIQGSCSLLCS